MILVNGQPANSVSINDRGLQFGDGVFETIALADGSLLCLQEHMQRLAAGCERLAIPDVDTDLVAADIATVCSGQSDAAVKVIITRGESARGYATPANIKYNRIVYSSEWPAELHTGIDQGITVCLCDTRLGRNPLLAGIKHLNRLEQVIARGEVTQRGCDEGVVLDTAGNVVEGTMSNLFLVHDETLLTPELDHCGVAGIVREHVLNAAALSGIKCEIRPVQKEEIESASELFFSNSLAGLRWARKFEARSFTTPRVTVILRNSLIDGNVIRSHR